MNRDSGVPVALVVRSFYTSAQTIKPAYRLMNAMRAVSALIMLLLAVPSVLAQSSPAPTMSAPVFCDRFTEQTEPYAALKSACEFATHMVKAMPNYICEQEVFPSRNNRRWQSKSKRPVISSEVRFVGGKEFYSNVKIDGQPTTPRVFEDVLWMSSAGEFGGLLPAIFDPRNDATFRFSKEMKLNSRRVYRFNFAVLESTNQSLWGLRRGNVLHYPGYQGTLWLDKETRKVVRIELLARKVDPRFSFKWFVLAVDYSEVRFPDDQTFLLPANSYSQFCDRTECLRNELSFQHCRKFGVETHIVPMQ